ncbi:MAG TPA: hypothetical protein VK919_10455 [Solirubrobacterales bacterium]|nr:hypothetical protein [Solirubrobacterales bacterium]
MRKSWLIGLAVSVFALIMFPAVATAQSGHFLTGGNNAPTCMTVGTGGDTQLQCSGKVAGLGGTTFEITVSAPATAQVECINPGGNRAPGQDTTETATGSSGPLATPRNGRYNFTVMTDPLGPLPATPTCPNPQWTPVIVGVTFGDATLSLFEDGVLVDQVTVPGPF